MRPLLLLLSCGVVAIGCSSSKSLTRDKAAAIIQKSERFQMGTPGIRISDDALQEGEAEGYWKKFGWSYELTDKGRTVFKTIGFPGGTPKPEWIVTAIVDVQRKVTEITGIEGQESNTSRWVDVSWVADVSGLPAGAQKLIGTQPPQKSRFLLTLYDDGWRVDERF